jgi:hypothetical protein
MQPLLDSERRPVGPPPAVAVLSGDRIGDPSARGRCHIACLEGRRRLGPRPRSGSHDPGASSATIPLPPTVCLEIEQEESTRIELLSNP